LNSTPPKNAHQECAVVLFPRSQCVNRIVAASRAGARLNKVSHNNQLRAECGTPFISRSIDALFVGHVSSTQFSESLLESWLP
jgi:hypothetical protein